MAMTLAQFTITKTPDDQFLIHIEDEDGQTLEFEASYDQLDLIQEAIEEHLEGDLDDPDALDDEIAGDDDE